MACRAPCIKVAIDNKFSTRLITIEYKRDQFVPLFLLQRAVLLGMLRGPGWDDTDEYNLIQAGRGTRARAYYACVRMRV